MAALCSARDVACASLLLPPSLMNAPLLEARMNTLGPMWTAARAEKSVLAWSLLEVRFAHPVPVLDGLVPTPRVLPTRRLMTCRG